MPTSGVDLVVGGLRGVGDAFDSANRNLNDQRALRDRRDEAQAKRDAEEIVNDRLGEIATTVDDITKNATDNPDYGHQDLIRDSKDIVKGSLELGKPEALRSLDFVSKMIEDRAKDKRANAANETAAEKEARRIREAAEKTAGDKRAEQRQIQDRYDNDDVTKQTVTVRSSFSKLQKAVDGEPSAANDISAIFQFMRINDPQSTVREGEFKTAEGARSFFSRITHKDENGNVVTDSGYQLPAFLVQAVQKLDPKEKGSFLLPEQKEAFRSAAEDAYRTQLEAQKRVDDRTMSQVTEIGVDRKKIIPRLADEDLADLDSRKKSREGKKAAADQNSALSINNKGQDTASQTAKQEHLKIIDEATLDRAMQDPDIQAKFAPGKAAFEARVQRPMTPDETHQAVIQILLKSGYTLGGPKNGGPQ